MNILVTGGAGFIGSHLVDLLVADGHTVFVLDTVESGSIENLPKGVTLFQRSITEDLDPVFEKAKPQVVFHLAAQIDVRKSIERPKEDAHLNIIGSLNLLEACRKHNCKRIIFSSTGGALYGETEQIPTPETHETKPESPYGIAKLAVEHYLHVYAHVYGFSVCILRYANVYGPRQSLKGEAGVVAVFTKRLLKKEKCIIFGDGNQTRDYVYVRDVVDANLIALHKQLQGTFNVGTGVETSVNDLYTKISKHTDFPWKAQHGAAIAGEIKRSCLANHKISPYWKPKYDVDRGLAETIEWFKEHSTKE
jgi:UDP-glucose 4-epimerase